jgi:hypothetical protein
MSNEFDDDANRWPAVSQSDTGHRAVALAPRLVARLYIGADRSLRARMVACLVRPLGPLGLAAIASGAFAGFVSRGTLTEVTGAIDDAARFSRDQVFELAHFSEQVNPDALMQLVGLFNDNPLGLAAFSAAALALLGRAVQRSISPAARAPERADRAIDGASGVADRVEPPRR